MHSVHPLINEARRAFPAARNDYTRARREGLGGDGTAQQGAGCADMEVAAERLLSVTRALLLVNADHGSAWNARKALVRDGVPESINVRQEIKAGFLQMAVHMSLTFVSPVIYIFRAVRASAYVWFFSCATVCPSPIAQMRVADVLCSARDVFHRRQRATAVFFVCFPLFSPIPGTGTLHQCCDCLVPARVFYLLPQVAAYGFISFCLRGVTAGVTSGFCSIS